LDDLKVGRAVSIKGWDELAVWNIEIVGFNLAVQSSGLVWVNLVFLHLCTVECSVGVLVEFALCREHKGLLAKLVTRYLIGRQLRVLCCHSFE
jgi:hypothetical protein